MDFQIYLDALPFLAPFFSATACITLVGFSLNDCISREERRLKNILITYLLLNIVVWLTLFCYAFVPKAFVYLRSICFVANILSPIFFYRILCLLMTMGQQENFSPLHYLAPLVVGGALVVWSFFIPFDVQETVKSSLAMHSGNNALYSKLSISPIAFTRTVFMLIYYSLFNLQLVRYTRWARDAKNLLSMPVNSVTFLVILSLFPIYFSIVAFLQTPDKMLRGTWGLMAGLGVFVQLIMLTYHIIRRKYLFYTKTDNDISAEENAPEKSGRRAFSGILTRERLEKWFRDKKPYLKTDFKITDIMKEMDVNRTVVSSFINKTYGMNFNRFVNRWRLKEFERLSLLFGNENESVYKLYAQAGFSELRQYYRAVAAEEKATGKGKGTEPPKNLKTKKQ